MLIGYLRSGVGGGDVLAAHHRALAEAGCLRVVDEMAAGHRREQPELHSVLGALQPGDVLVVPELGCLGRSLPEVVLRMQQVSVAGAGLRSLYEGLDTTTPEGQAAAGMIGGLAGLGRGRRDERVAAEVATTRAAGRKPGRRPKLTGQQRAAVVEAVLSGRSTAATMARRHEVSEATISRVLARHRALADAPAGNRLAVLNGAQDASIADALPASALDERLAIVGTSGSGKTYAAKGLVERLVDQGARVCIVDPLGVWWGLRTGSDGGASPLRCPVVVFGGRHADVPLDESMGWALGHVIGTHQVACVVDVSDLGSAAARRGFMSMFTEALYAANTAPLHLVLDEADLWAPQRAQPDGYDLLQRVEEIVRRGRIRGFVPWLITQRPAVLHKDVLSQADVLVSMKLTSSQDREAVGRWIEGQADRAEGRRILAALPRLARGEGWVWAPSDGVLERVAFPRIRTLDSSATPVRDEKVGTPGRLAPVDLATLTAALAGAHVQRSGELAPPAPAERSYAPGLERQLRQRDAELALARAELARLEAEAVRMQARLHQAGAPDDRTASANPSGE